MIGSSERHLHFFVWACLLSSPIASLISLSYLCRGFVLTGDQDPLLGPKVPASMFDSHFSTVPTRWKKMATVDQVDAPDYLVSDGADGADSTRHGKITNTSVK